MKKEVLLTSVGGRGYDQSRQQSEPDFRNIEVKRKKTGDCIRPRRYRRTREKVIINRESKHEYIRRKLEHLEKQYKIILYLN